MMLEDRAGSFKRTDTRVIITCTIKTDTQQFSDKDTGPRGFSTEHLEQTVPPLVYSLMRHRDDY